LVEDNKEKSTSSLTCRHCNAQAAALLRGFTRVAFEDVALPAFAVSTGQQTTGRI
jgi:hypothetical protein